MDSHVLADFSSNLRKPRFSLEVIMAFFAVNASGLVAFTAVDNLPNMLANQETIFTPL